MNVISLAVVALAYVDSTPSLGQLMKESTTIVLLRVEKVSPEKRIIVYRKVSDLKGTHPTDEVKHQITDGWHPREPRAILDWAEPGKLAVSLHDGKSAVTCIGHYWYQSWALEAPWWTMTSGRAELSLAFHGPAERLGRAMAEILEGKEVILTAITHGPQGGLWQHGNAGFQKVLRGRESPVWRIKASLEMPSNAWEIGKKDSKWVVGPGATGPEDVPALIEALRDPKRRRGAADDLALIGPNARAAIPDLAKAFGDADSQVRVSAARAVGLIGQDHAEVLPVLERALKDPAAAARKSAALALGDLGSQAAPSVPALIEAMEDGEAGVRWAAADALGRLGAAAEAAVPALAGALRDPGVRAMAVDALGSIGPPARGAVPLLLDLLKDEDAGLRWIAGVALARIDARSARAALPLFIQKLRSADGRARWDAMMVVNYMGLAAKPAAPAVLEMVKQGDGVAACTMSVIAGPEAMEALPLLLQILSDEWDSSWNIAQLGPAAGPELLKLVEKADSTNRHLAIKALGLIGLASEEVVPALIRAVAHPEAGLRIAAADALAGIEPRVAEAVPALLKALEDPEAGVRLAAARALRAIQGDKASAVVRAMVKLLAEGDSSVRPEAARLLADFGAQAKEARPALERAIKDGDAAVRHAAALALARISGSQALADAVKVMVASLKDKDPNARADAARSLGQLGAEARSAIPALTAALQDESGDVRQAAREALRAIPAK